MVIIIYYYTKLSALNDEQQRKFGCKYIVQVREKNLTTGYLFPEYRRKFENYKDARNFQIKLQKRNINNL